MTGKNKNLEKCLEESQESGILNISHRNMREFPSSVDNYDLTDVVRADISNNKFSDIPGELTDAFMMECLNCAYNNIRFIQDFSHITSLTYLNLGHNQIQTLPIHVCSLPLKTLILNHNRLHFIPGEIGLLGKLQHLDVSCNEISNVPSTFGELVSLRILNLRRNQLLSLPDEISKLKHLMTLDISCNRISILPPAFRLITSMVKLDLKDNPMTCPPAQVCLKGRLHVFKYLSLTAHQQQEKSWSLDRDPKKISKRSPSSSSISSSSLLENDLKLNHIDESRESQEEADRADNRIRNVPQAEERECLTPSSPVIHSVNKYQQQKTMSLKGGNNPPTHQIEAIEQGFGFLDIEDPGSVVEEKPETHVEDMRKLERRIQQDHKLLQQKMLKEHPQPQYSKQKTATLSRNQEKKPAPVGQNTMSLDRASVRKYGSKIKSYAPDVDTQTDIKENVDVSEKKEQLLKMRQEAMITKQKLDKIKAEPTNVYSGSTSAADTAQGKQPSAANKEQAVFEGIGKRSSLSKIKTAKVLKEGHSSFTMRRIFDSAKEEFQQLEKLRMALESRLSITLPDDLPAALSDGVVLCHLVNHVTKSTIPVIHVPSAGMPKLTMPKCLMNVDAFLEGCRKLGVDKTHLCSPADILEEKSPNKVCVAVHALFQAASFTNL